MLSQLPSAFSVPSVPDDRRIGIDEDANDDGSNDDDDQDQDVQQQQQNLLAGFIRAFTKPFRAFFKAKRLHIGHKRALAKGVDQLTTALDMSKEVWKVPEEQSSLDTKGHRRLQKIKLQIRRVFLAFPGFVKSTVLGTASFAMQEACSDVLQSQKLLMDQRIGVATLCGFVAGLTSGALFHLWSVLVFHQSRMHCLVTMYLCIQIGMLLASL